MLADRSTEVGRAATRPTSRRRRISLRKQAVPYLFLSPALVLFLVFVLAPVIGAAVLSFYSWDLLSPAHFSGLSNYRELFSDHKLGIALENTFIFTFWSIVLHVVFGLALALAVNRPMARLTRYFLRTAFFFPFFISWAAVALIWQYAFDPTFGAPTQLLLSERLALPALIFVDFWHTIGFAFIVILAGLQTIPQHLYEAATVDGSGVWRRFWDVTVPMLSPTLFFVCVISFMGAFQIFDPMFIMTRGGPNGATESAVEYIYETSFRDFQVGYAAAVALVVFGIILVATLVQFKLRRFWVFEE
jgi:ABC-type sugar transport system permease subunit